MRRFLKQVAFNSDKIGLFAGGDEGYLVFHAKLPRAVDEVAGKHVGQRYALIGRRGGGSPCVAPGARRVQLISMPCNGDICGNGKPVTG